jgi:CarD family transcriptional regulator
MEDHSDDLDAIEPMQAVEFAVGDSVVYPHHGAGQVVRKEVKEVLGERREYLTIKILHNDMTVMVPTANAARAGLRRVIDEDTVKKVLAVLQDECSEMPKNWNRRFKHNRDKIKTGDVYELAEVVRNLAIREAQKGLSTGEKQMFTRARKILASELMYALEMTAEQVEVHLDSLLLDPSGPAGAAIASNGKVAAADGKLRPVSGKASAGPIATNGKLAAALPSLDGDLAFSPE